MRNFTQTFDDLGYEVMPGYEREPEPLADILRKSISRPGAPALSAVLVRSAISLEMSTAFPVVALRQSNFREIAERLPAQRTEALISLRIPGTEIRLGC